MRMNVNSIVDSLSTTYVHLYIHTYLMKCRLASSGDWISLYPEPNSYTDKRKVTVLLCAHIHIRIIKQYNTKYKDNII